METLPIAELNGFHTLDARQANAVGPFPEDTACIAACKKKI